MVTRKKIGLNYSYNEGWIGGTYYLENLVKAINLLDDTEKPEFTVITDTIKEFERLKLVTNYPYLRYRLKSGERNKLLQYINRASKKFFGGNIFSQQIKGLDAIFPYHKCKQFISATKKIYWIPDFQHRFYPEFFSEQEVAHRNNDEQEIAETTDHLVLSSENVLSHFKHFHPKYKVNTHILPFAVDLPVYSTLEISTLLAKYQLPSSYLMSPNQFWKHKNQIVILKALAWLKNKGLPIPTIVFTGNTTDYRNPGYFDSLKDFIIANNLSESVHFLGFIDRGEQLKLMEQAKAIIQPSLFEGWSTVIEDCKAMNKMVIASLLEVNKEQLINSNALYFDPADEKELALLIKDLLKDQKLYESYNYLINQKTFGLKFLDIVISS